MKKNESRFSQASKGCLKISSFFSKNANGSVPTVPKKTEVVLVDSDSDNEQETSKSSITKKRKVCYGKIDGEPHPKKTNDIIRPSTSERLEATSSRDLTPERQIIKTQTVFVKSAEKLLSPAALKNLISCNKSEKSKSPTMMKSPRKLNFTEDVPNTNRTPVKSSQSTPKNSPVISKQETPLKSRRTPKKLFEKSPEKLNTFKVEIINKFVKITPSKSSEKSDEKDLQKSSEKKQSSIVKYFESPSLSRRSLEAQNVNERTPTKHVLKSNSPSPVAKAKTKLDFSCGSDSKNHEVNFDVIERENNDDEKNVEEKSTEEISNKIIEKENNSNLSNIDYNFDDSWDGNLECNEEFNLEFNVPQHCKVTKITEFHQKNILTLKSTKTGELGLCTIEGFWVDTKLAVGDTVHVTAEKIDGNWVVDNKNGILVFEPDLLISTTSVVNMVFCKRKSVLQERYKGFEPANKFMVIGTLVHTLLEEVLTRKAKDLHRISMIAKALIRNSDTIRKIYECGETFRSIEDQFLEFVPKIANFVSTYLPTDDTPNQNRQMKQDQWQGKISQITDIEECIWSPELGIKGKIDVSIKNNSSEVMPLELKTGKASSSLEHRGQVMMYIMMMNQLGYKVSSGLLLYLREGVLKEVSMTPQERRDILIMRNELTYFLTRQPKLIDKDNEKKLLPAEIPEVINHRACANCPYSVMCCSYARATKEDISKNKALSQIYEETVSKFSDEHIEYFIKWGALIALESDYRVGSKDLRDIYTLPPKTREANGKCIINVNVVSVGAESNGIFPHTFEKTENSSSNFLACGISENNYVVVSTDSRPAVAAGFVTEITVSSITVTLERNLNKRYSGLSFHIDSYDSNSFQSYNLASLSLLLEATPRGDELRKIVVDKQPPTFESKLPKAVAKKGTPILKRLNKVQQRAVLKALAANDYLLIKGMPGTGKTATLVALIQLLVELNKSVIITSHTHSAVDNVCSRLVTYGVKFMRLGSVMKMREELKPFSEHQLTKDCMTPEQLEEVYSSIDVFAVTCLGSNHPVLTKRTMDVCIVDESTQVMQCSVIRSLYAAKKFILIGDPDQLPAVVRNEEAVKMGMSESLFERLQSPESVIDLNLNYRMNKPITELANRFTYKGELLIGSDRVANATLNLPKKPDMLEEYKDITWVLEALDDKLDSSVQFIDTGPVWKLDYKIPWMNKLTEDTEQQNCMNPYEAAVVKHLVMALLKGGISCDKIGVIATFRAQVQLLTKLLSSENIDISTVDQFQGKDKNVIIYSCTKSKDITNQPIRDKKSDILEDKRRLTVAITRAKNKLIVIGDAATLQQYTTFQNLLPHIKNSIKLENVEGFSWTSTLNSNFCLLQENE